MAPERLGYTGPTPTVLRNGRHVAPGSPIDPDELEDARDAVEADEENGVEAEPAVTAERDFYDEQGWLEPIEVEDESSKPTLEVLRARAAELEIAGRSTMNADELHASILGAEQAARDAEGGES